MKVSLKRDKNTIEVPPTLLNPQDTVVVKFITNRPTNDFVFDSRIYGVNKAKPRRNIFQDYWKINGNKFTIYFFISQFFSVGLMLSVVSFFASPPQNLERANELLGTLKPTGPVLMLFSLLLYLFVLGTIGGYVKGGESKVTVGKVKRKNN